MSLFTDDEGEISDDTSSEENVRYLNIIKIQVNWKIITGS